MADLRVGRLTAQALEIAQFSAGGKCSVFTRRRRQDPLVCHLHEIDALYPPRLLCNRLRESSEVGGSRRSRLPARGRSGGCNSVAVRAIAEAESTTGLVAGGPSVDRLTSNAEMVG